MMSINFNIILTSFVAAAAGIGRTGLCTEDPPLAVDAGSNFSASIFNPAGEKCEAWMDFSNTSYLPIVWFFSPVNCSGFELAELTVPEEVPDGDAFLTWQCAGAATSTCNRITISNGSGSLDLVPLEQLGHVGCASIVEQTVTTSIVRTVTAGTVVETSTNVATITTPMLSTASIRGPTPTLTGRGSGIIDPVPITVMTVPHANSATGGPLGSAPASAVSQDKTTITVTVVTPGPCS